MKLHKMLRCVFIFCFTAFTKVLTVPVSNATGCSLNGQNYFEGAIKDDSPIWYACKNGHFTPGGCISEADGKRYKFSEVFEKSGYEVRCLFNEGVIRFEVTSCIYDGKRVSPGDTYDDNFFWYTCNRTNSTVYKEVSGCKDDSGRRVAIGGTIQTANYMFECRQIQGGNLEFKPTACIKDGNIYKVNETFSVGQFWYTCAHENGYVVIKLSGCVNSDGKQLKDGEKYYRNGFVVECQVHNGESVAHTVVGCLKTSDHSDNDNSSTTAAPIEKKIGETWLAGSNPFLFIIQCQKLPEGARQTLIKCRYERQNEKFDLEPGCYREINGNVISCTEKIDGGLSMNSHTKAGLPSSLRDKLKSC